MASPGHHVYESNDDRVGSKADHHEQDNNDEVRSKAYHLDEREPCSDFESMVLSMLNELQGSMQSMKDRVLDLEEAQAQSAAAPNNHVAQSATSCEISQKGKRNSIPEVQSTENMTLSPAASGTTKHWADMDGGEIDYAAEVTWEIDPDDDFPEGKGAKLFKVTEKTEKFLSAHFTAAVPNQTRRQWRDKYGAPNTPTTACPNLDKVIKGRLSAVIKSQDRQLARQQSLMLDAVGPITHILEEAAKGELSQKSAMEAAQTALKLLGNASVQASRDRRKLALKSLNSGLVDMAEDDFLFRNAAPSLFGDGFSKKAKERDEELRCLNQATSSKPSSQYKGNNFFRRGRPYNNAPRGTGQTFRGRRGGFQRNHPYQRPWNRKPPEEKKN